ncbi:HAMP domain-containing histidine kinase [Ihubacter massiliensis]|uniref:histidine kinase n=1 Tax=Hominibacterium faecale TaxID=2839743 RepID=A0A9J6QZA1_9FIRM|nr:MULTISPECIES: HAMP domain-containing sensor histidine kinase [Eubacteriales Family XIII. Incertae Sedis]MCO7120558.1 HAMP domain-containing histidine kinase [Ihubacter massiliensis]MCU7380765.1 HAMP domain-containing histidine kinase [Hominibacterium faecale]
MELWLWALIGLLALIILCLVIKIYLLRKSAKEIREAFADRLMTETNTLIDLSSRDKALRQLADSMNDQLRQLRKDRLRFQQGDLELKEAITNISHDLRTPLTAICGYLELLKREETTDAAARYLDVIENRTQVLKQLTEELFRYSIAASAFDDMACEEIALNDVLEESVSVYYAALKGCQICPQISMPKQKVRRTLNKNALSRIFGNIVSNAIKYSNGDLQIVLQETGELVFSNHASALDEIQVGKMFDRFYTVETANKSTGLGLAIAKMLTEQMNGSIRAVYQDNILSIFIFFPK